MEYHFYHTHTKGPCLKTPGNFRPISCCHLLYKCVTKLICSKLRRVLNSIIISSNHEAFVVGRSISHNTMLCQDRKGCSPSCLIKVDVRKTYDKVDWLFIKDMLVTLNFPSHFIKIVMACISYTQYSLSVNGSQSAVFRANKGLR
ncbi:uncharacterized protein LOC130805675 [Amaranthus tricolor]|uniref:uncharacterized protein LOC130805675 n=1 Tax=Amaranthus tricolor TaxID=29722 RepID=UPI00258ED135|nr:uncharacterized protein LOC130805675 [Amaranthus tricolor]